MPEYVSDEVIGVTLVVFSGLLSLALQQFCVQRTTEKAWLLSRLFITITCLNECIIMVILLAADTEENGDLVILIRCLVWINNAMGSFVVYKLGGMGTTWMYRQLNPNTTKIPLWFRVIWALIMGSNAAILVITAIMSLAQGTTAATNFHAVYLDFVSVVVNIIYLIICWRVAYKLHDIMRKRRKAYESHAKHNNNSVQRGNTETEQEVSRSGTYNGQQRNRSVKKLTNARNKVIVILLCFFIAIPVTILGTFTALDHKSSEKITTPRYVSANEFRDHFLYSFLYVLSMMLLIFQNTKCCATSAIDNDSIYIWLCLDKLHFKGFNEPYWFCKMFGCQDCWFMKIITRRSKLRLLEKTTASEANRSVGTGSSEHRQLNNATDSSANTKSGSSATGNSSSNSNDSTGAKGTKTLKITATRKNTDSDDEENVQDISLLLREVENIVDTDSKAKSAPNNNLTADRADTNVSPRSPGSRMFRSKSWRKIYNIGTDGVKHLNNNDSDYDREDSYKQHERAQQIVTADDVGNANDVVVDVNVDSGPEDTPTQRRDSVTRGYEETEQDLPDAQKELSLRNMDWKARELKKRRKAKANKTSQAVKDAVRAKDQNNQLTRITDENARDPTQYDMLKNKDETYAGYLHGVSVKDDTTIGDTRTDGLIDANKKRSERMGQGLVEEDQLNGFDDGEVNTFKKIVSRPDQPVTLVIFEFEDVLCTNMKSVEGLTAHDISNTDLKKMLLTFGGVDRLEELHEHLSEVIMTTKDRSCFLLTNEMSETVFKVLERVDMAQYFISLNATSQGRKKKLSHVIGSDHKLIQDSEGKKHLLLLKLIKFLKRDQSRVLYVGNDRATIDHLNKINVCFTYWVKTKGLIHHDLKALAENFFLMRPMDEQPMQPMQPMS